MAYKILKPKNPPKDNISKDKENWSLYVKCKYKKQASKKLYQGTNHLSPPWEDQAVSKEDSMFFWCGIIGHTYCEFLKHNTKYKSPKVRKVMTTSFDDLQRANQLCYIWGKTRDQHALILMDLGSTHNIISMQLAEKLGIKVGDMGPAL